MLTKQNKSDIKIHPTNNCFSDVIDFINWEFQDLVKRKVVPLERNTPLAHEWAKKRTICHGLLLDTDGEPYSHAWIETDKETVFHFGILDGEIVRCEFPKSEYYQEMQVKEVTRYSIMEAIDLEKKHGKPGPWIKKYYKLCRDYRGIK